MFVTLLCDISRRGHQHHTGEAVELPFDEASALVQAGAAIAGGGPKELLPSKSNKPLETAAAKPARNAMRPSAPNKRKPARA